MNDMFTPWYGFHIKPKDEGWYQGRSFTTGALFWIFFEVDDGGLWQCLHDNADAEWRGLLCDPTSLEFWESI